MKRRQRKRKHNDTEPSLLSNQSSVESIDPRATIPFAGKRKFVALETKRYVAIAHLQQRLRRAERNSTVARGDFDKQGTSYKEGGMTDRVGGCDKMLRGSTLVDVPTFESCTVDFERICTAPKNLA